MGIEEDMDAANCALFLAIVIPVIGICAACSVLSSAPAGSRRARVARIALAISLLQIVLGIVIIAVRVSASR